MNYQYEQRSIQQQRNWLSWLWWPITIIFAGLLIYQSQMTIRIFGLYPFDDYISEQWLVQTLIPGLALGIAEWVALWLIAHNPRRHWGIVGVTLASYLVTAPFAQDAQRISNAFIPFYSGHTVRVMFLNAIMTGLLQWGTLALLQALFLPLLLKVRWRYALLWILVGVLASLVAPDLGVLTALVFYSPSELLPTLAEYSIYGVITGLPLIWLVANSAIR